MKRAVYFIFVIIGLAIILSCGNESTEPNNPPSTPIITVSSTTVESEGAVNLSASADDPDDDPLTYAWSATGGSFNTTTGQSVVWTAPAVSDTQQYTISVEVEDDEGASASNSVNITVVYTEFEPSVCDYIQVYGSPTDVEISGTSGYLTAETYYPAKGYLYEIDVSNPVRLQLDNSWDLVDQGKGVEEKFGHLYLACADSGLYVFWGANTGSYNTPGVAYEVLVTGSEYIFVADGDAGIGVFDIVVIPTPRNLGYYDTPGTACDLAMTGTKLLVADGSAGFRIFDISDVMNLQEEGSYDTPGFTYGITVSGTYVYLADGDIGIWVFDITNPLSPQQIGYYNTPGSAYNLDVSGSRLYVADGIGGLLILDISDPSNPTKLWTVNPPIMADDVDVVGSYAYVAGTYDISFSGLISIKIRP